MGFVHNLICTSLSLSLSPSLSLSHTFIHIYPKNKKYKCSRCCTKAVNNAIVISCRWFVLSYEIWGFLFHSYINNSLNISNICERNLKYIHYDISLTTGSFLCFCGYILVFNANCNFTVGFDFVLDTHCSWW